MYVPKCAEFFHKKEGSSFRMESNIKSDAYYASDI